MKYRVIIQTSIQVEFSAFPLLSVGNFKCKFQEESRPDKVKF